MASPLDVPVAPPSVLPDPRLGRPLTRLSFGTVKARVFLERASEAADFDEPSQDYVVVRRDAARVCFAVTDGVSASFMGDIAAQTLAIGLVDWLSGYAHLLDERGFQQGMEQHLAELAKLAQEKVLAARLPDDLVGLMRDALEQQRSYGSEAMFVCGSVELGRSGRPSRFAWLGDAFLHLSLSDGAAERLTGTGQHRWSSRLGVRGDVGHRSLATSQLRRVIAYTDGLIPEIASVLNLSDSRLRPRLAALARRADGDDMAFVDVALTRGALPARWELLQRLKSWRETASGGRAAVIGRAQE